MNQRKDTGKFANYQNVASRVDGIHQVNEDRVSIKTDKPTFSEHPIYGQIVECSATVTIYPKDLDLPDQLEYDGHAKKVLAKPDGKGGWRPEQNIDNLYEIVETKAIGRALAAAGYLTRKDDGGKMDYATEEDINESKRQETDTAMRKELETTKRRLREVEADHNLLNGLDDPRGQTNKETEDKARMELERRGTLAENLDRKLEQAKAIEAEVKKVADTIVAPEDATLTPQLWKTWLDAAKIPEDTFQAIDGSQQKASVLKLAQIFQTYQSKPVMKPEVLKAQLESQYKVTNPRLLSDEQADQLIAEIKGVQ